MVGVLVPMPFDKFSVVNQVGREQISRQSLSVWRFCAGALNDPTNFQTGPKHTGPDGKNDRHDEGLEGKLMIVDGFENRVRQRKDVAPAENEKWQRYNPAPKWQWGLGLITA
jgi:hypothetical protein